MAGLNVSRWQAGRRGPVYSPVQQFYLRNIRTAHDEAMAVAKVACPYFTDEPYLRNDPRFQSWDDAIMARDWVSRATPNPKLDREGYLLSFENACHVLWLNYEYEMLWMLEEIDAAADFDTDECHARVAYLTANPPDEVEETEFEGFRVVPKLDQGSLFSNAA